MPLKESLAEIVGGQKQRGVIAGKETAEFVELKESRFNQLKEREKLLIKQAEVELTPSLKRLNDTYYGGEGEIKMIPLSEEDPLRRASYEPFLYGWGKTKAEVRIELHRPKEERASCFFKLWEKEKEGKQRLIVYFPSVQTRVETYTYFFGLIKANNLVEGDDWKIFNLEEPGTLPKVEEYLLEMSQISPFFSFVPR